MWSDHYYLVEYTNRKSIFKQLGGTYEQYVDYFSPCLVLCRKRKACGDLRTVALVVSEEVP